MKHAPFGQSNGTLLGGPGVIWGTTHDVEDLIVYRDEKEIISCWRPSWSDRLRVLFGSPIWLRVAASTTHPPVCLETGDIWKVDGDG